MSLEMWQRLKSLERRVEELEKKPAPAPAPAVEKAVVKTKMCPKCGEKPAYFFHVKYCQKNKNNGPTEKTDG